MNAIVITALIAASAAGYGLMYLAMRKGGHKKQDYQAFADKQGWQYEQISDTTRTTIDRFRDPADNWRLDLVFIGGGPNTVGSFSGSTRRRMEWHCPTGAIEGEAALGMPLPEKSVNMMRMGGDMGKQILKAALKGTFYAIGETRFTLTIDEASAGDPSGVVMSTPGQEKAMDAFRRNTDLAGFRMGRNAADVPVVIRNQDGITLRRQGIVKDLDDLPRLADLGKSLRGDL
ncbi:hypothetical protein [Halocynthiibacter styelae]|uniref:Uncharacterized protein n=1 Tax=Halocynthiibacter styelae TaxID=2761955 RepID=A0A8J7IVT5_9RHOB|nr:hypothetical protein [Paenihalocynthiibacter styelae]MBI1493578.1 hypothetical protein [Paenihalocynthiibacter styelae]